MSALDATATAGSFHIRYRLTEDLYPGGTMTLQVPCWQRPVDLPPRRPAGPQNWMTPAPATSTSTSTSSSTSSVPGCCAHPGAGTGSGPAPVCTVVRRAPEAVPLVGAGTVDVAPYAMVVSVRSAGHPGWLSLRVDPQTVWEGAPGDTGLVPAGRATPWPIDRFGAVAIMSLGEPEAAVAVLALANPMGYLDLTGSEVRSATALGGGTVDGQPVTVYQVPVGRAQIAGTAGTSPAQAAAVDQALQVLDGQGYTGTTVRVSVGPAGTVLASQAVATFGGGRTVTLSATLSDVGSAGRVVMPGAPAAA